ncbi:sensor histidine kinase [Roseateles saccharophilus]|uniref:histidine kinase n=1 Tax=Roseateles saccharophilus TaxID=304 RepID=A0A4R3UPK4_ROSSA|nr:HAMP domain-containing sensor histidine kinase [Roseateles saccharophilus]MDG0834673.1 HAMP domain-containing histidine kinase [Roseateles saccharophilus]TCU92671.1 two-component system heavy metal sensor histidine kinase CusS [Roseateles saccharophilus]
MKSIGSRITLWYAITLTATLACLFIAGHYLLERYLVKQLDELTETQFKHLAATLGRDYASLTPQVIDERIREATESASSMFYVDMHGPMTNRFFKSHNLHGMAIPDLIGEKTYSITVEGLGEVRVGEYSLQPFDVLIATPMAPVLDLMGGYRRVFFGLLGTALVLSVVIGYGLSELILKPVRVIQATALRIRSDNLAERIPVADVQDELSQLARFLNQMFDRLERSFSEIRHFAAEASHELKTPLSLVRLHMERLLVDDGLSAVQKESIVVQLEEIGRVNRIIDELLFLSRADAGAVLVDLKPQRPEQLLGAFAQDAAALAEHDGKRFEWSHHGDGSVDIDAKRIRQVLLNVLTNALKVSPRGSLVSLASTLADGLWRISLVDEGPGLSAEDCERIFDRFVRLGAESSDPRGSGLGLPISRSIVTMHKGRIWATSRDVGRGLRVVIEIPTSAG